MLYDIQDFYRSENLNGGFLVADHNVSEEHIVSILRVQ
jgi:hypothetical protein